MAFVESLTKRMRAWRRSGRSSSILEVTPKSQAQFPRYQQVLFSHIQPLLKGRICEVGSGSGNLTQYLAGYERVTAIEPVRSEHPRALQRFAYQLNIECVPLSIEDCPHDRVPAGRYDTVFSVNVLEHLQYDITALEIMGELLTPTGHVVVIVPAYMSIFGSLDRAKGHWRRYNRALLEQAFVMAGLQVTHSRYFDMLGWLAWCLYGGMFRRQQISPPAARFYDRWVSLGAWMDRHLGLPFGQSLLMVGRRRKND